MAERKTRKHPRANRISAEISEVHLVNEINKSTGDNMYPAQHCALCAKTTDVVQKMNMKIGYHHNIYGNIHDLKAKMIYIII